MTTLHWSESSVPRREAKQTIQLFLYCLCPSAAGNKEATIIEKFASWYLHARHSPAVSSTLSTFLNKRKTRDVLLLLIKTSIYLFLLQCTL